MNRTVFYQLALPAFVVGLVLASPFPLAADEAQGCSVATLKGNYGLHATGNRPAGPGVTETHATIALRTYDGEGGVTSLGVVSNGEVSGVRQGILFTGTYEVAPDCTGKITLVSPAVPRSIEAAFVIVDRGREIGEVPISSADIGIAILRQVVTAPTPDEALAAQLSDLQAKLDRMATTLSRLAIRFSIVP